jgi:hypothetical protein
MDLLHGPGAEMIAEKLSGEVISPSNALSIGGLGDAGAMLDMQSKQEYRRRLGELREELGELHERGDYERGDKIEAEIGFSPTRDRSCGRTRWT